MNSTKKDSSDESSRKMKLVSDIMQSPRWEKRYCALISTQSFSRTTPKLLNTSATKAYIRVGRCVVKICSNSTATFATRVVEDTSRNILLAVLICHRFIKIHESSPGDSVPKAVLSGLITSTKRKYAKTTLSELIHIVRTYPALMNDIYFVIPRLLEIDYSLSVSSIVKRIFSDYIEYIQYFGTLAEIQDGKVQNTLLIDYLRQSTLPIYRPLKRALRSVI